METFFIITQENEDGTRNYYFKDMAMAIIQFREFMEQAGVKDKIEGNMPVVFEYGDGCKLTLREKEWDDNKLYHL